MLHNTDLSFSLVPTISVQVAENVPPTFGQSGYSLTCSAGGTAAPGIVNPSIMYQWTKNNGTQTQIQVGGDPEILSFSPLRLSDAGQYTCEVMINSSYLNTITEMGFSNVAFPSEFYLVTIMTA